MTLEYSYVEDQLKELSRPGCLAHRSRFIDICSWWSTFGFPFSIKLKICRKMLKIPNRKIEDGQTVQLAKEKGKRTNNDV